MWLFKSTLIVFFISINSAFANEAAAPAAPAAAESNITFSGRQDESWQQMQTDLGTLKTKLDAQDAIVKELLINKRNNKGKISADQVEQLNSNHQKLQEMSKEYNQKLSEFELRYPEKGQAAGRQYTRKKISSLEEMESSLTLDGRIKKINRKIKSQYSKSEDEKEDTSKKVLKTDAEKKPEVKPNKPLNDVTDKIILVK